MTTDQRARSIGVHLVLIAYSLLAVGPILLVVMNSFKVRSAIFGSPLAPPDASTFSLIGYEKVFRSSHILLYYSNSLIVTLVSMALVLLFGAMAAWALTEYRFRGSTALALFLSIGIMVPIRLGSVAILNMMRSAGLNDTLTALVLVYVAQGLPMSIFILSEFIQQIPKDLRDAARCDGVPETRIFFEVVAPLLRPAIATVAVFTIVPIWNDLWFPLILTSSDSTHTVTLGVQQFLGQYITDWNSVLAALSMAILPVVIIYVILSRQLIAGLTSGAVK
ncbi:MULTISPECIES: carbohydrate ABC transporter permease [Bradyrhizobium]|jgi:raffinose/stachyose/melibiose transport system permease protein|uniref:Sugar ABC transporter permease n=1 Tax=Bradyrhizobium manausense TaxID=989370 RepID=A0A0R3D2I1_9BRAD|nr:MULTISPECIES: carbohydrate ABC transporter permease [Bradyrhizobium]KRQ01007.1 sugar ABC transporter permease [Bradyrhizobium manausense]MDA9411011.1 sugar ABC transporter permease [Bradyrhizobium sp. CCBAU 45384]MDA9442560.1 sugar ABC transporter permease [Bradyrhizobium sp. CCBAU 51745]